MTGFPALVTMAGAYPTGCCVWKALNNIALFRRTVLVNNNKSMNIYSLALGSHTPHQTAARILKTLRRFKTGYTN